MPFGFLKNQDTCQKYLCQGMVWGCIFVLERGWYRNSKTSISWFEICDVKNKLLGWLQFQKSAGLPINCYFFNNQLLCVGYFCAITGLSKYYAITVLNDFHKGWRRYVHASENQSKCTASCTTFICWMKRFSENFGQDGPTDIVTVLPSYLNKAELYTIYSKEACKPHVKLSTFYKLMKSKFGPRREDKSLPWIRISRVSTHSKCNMCLGLDHFQRKCKSDAELEFCKGVIPCQVSHPRKAPSQIFMKFAAHVGTHEIWCFPKF